nr:MAG TPA: hypothetical protein [Caudoviricetes sp.]
MDQKLGINFNHLLAKQIPWSEGGSLKGNIIYINYPINVYFR